MEFGHLNVMQNWHKDLDDFQSWQGEIDLAILCDEVGFDALACVEHHFEAYGMCGDNLQYLSYLAGRTKNATLMPGAIILPWNNPLRIVEKLAMLEYVAPGRVAAGFGRGLSKKEYNGFQIDMNEARGRFDEAAEFILRGLENGYVEGDGPYYPQPRTDIRPKPIKGYRDTLFCVAMSPDSADAAAKLGARMMTFIQYPIELHVPMIEAWRTTFRANHPGVPVPAPILTDVTLCCEDPDEAKELAYIYLKNHFMAVMDHYDFAGDHFKEIKGYEAYQAGADLIKQLGMDEACTAYIEAQNWGTPDQIIEKYEQRHDLLGDFSALVVLSYGGIPFEVANRSARLFGEQVIPRVKKMWANTPSPAWH